MFLKLFPLADVLRCKFKVAIFRGVDPRYFNFNLSPSPVQFCLRAVLAQQPSSAQDTMSVQCSAGCWPCARLAVQAAKLCKASCCQAVQTVQGKLLALSASYGEPVWSSRRAFNL